MKILIIEDDNFFQNFFSQKFIEAGLEVDKAKNGKEALALLEKSKYDLILLDLIMPEMDGFEVLENIRRNKQLSPPPIIVLSSAGMEQDVQKARGLGAADFISKNYLDTGSLVEKIKSYIKK